MMIFGWSVTSGPLCAPTRAPPLLASPIPTGGTCGGVQLHGTTPTQVLLVSTELDSPTKRVCDSPSVTSATRVRELRKKGPLMMSSCPPAVAIDAGTVKSREAAGGRFQGPFCPAFVT